MAIDSRYAAGVPTMAMRGGTSKGLFFLRDNLPTDRTERDELLLSLMGSPDPRQIDGLGGAHPLTSKVAVVGPSTTPDADIEYLFLQVSVDQALVSDRQNCGNIVAAVAPFALETGLVTAPTGATNATVRIRLLNTNGTATATVLMQDGIVQYELPPDDANRTTISGVPGYGAPVQLDFDDTMGSSCGAFLPTGNSSDQIDGIAVTMIDNGMPVVLLRAADLGMTGYESPADLDADDNLKSRIESIRLQAGPLMNLGDVSETTIPKMTLVSPPTQGGAINTRTFIPHRCHDAIGVLGAVSVASALGLSGSVTEGIAKPPASSSTPYSIEHPTGTFDAIVEIAEVDGAIVIERSGIVRTARKLMDGLAFPHRF